MEKYTIEQLRGFLHYIIDQIADKALLYGVWTKLERAYIRQ